VLSTTQPTLRLISILPVYQPVASAILYAEYT
jgi:hypothetical protein